MKNILITGSTGFLGGAVVAKILELKEKIDILLLVRAESKSDGLDRVKKNLLKFCVDDEFLGLIKLENILLGDLSEPESYLSDDRMVHVTHVINCAAIASFGSNKKIWKVNVVGTFELAKKVGGNDGFKKFLHVGTAMSCSPEPNSVVKESIIHTKREDHVVEYTWSKANIERMIMEELPNLPFVIARPSIVVGHSKYGCTPSASIFWVFKMALMLGKFHCDLSDKIDVVPVDYCADALIKLIKMDSINHDIFHISAGVDGSVSFAEIDIAMAVAEGVSPVGDNYEKVNSEDLRLMKGSFKDIFGPCNERMMLKAMDLYGHFSKLNVSFDNEKIKRIGINKPKKLTEYIDKCLRSVEGKSIPELMEVDFK